MYTAREVADILRVSPSQAYKLVAIRKLTCHRIGGRNGMIRISAADAEDYLAQCRGQHGTKPYRPWTQG